MDCYKSEFGFWPLARESLLLGCCSLTKQGSNFNVSKIGCKTAIELFFRVTLICSQLSCLWVDVCCRWLPHRWLELVMLMWLSSCVQRTRVMVSTDMSNTIITHTNQCNCWVVFETSRVPWLLFPIKFVNHPCKLELSLISFTINDCIIFLFTCSCNTEFWCAWWLLQN